MAAQRPPRHSWFSAAKAAHYSTGCGKDKNSKHLRRRIRFRKSARPCHHRLVHERVPACTPSCRVFRRRARKPEAALAEALGRPALLLLGSAVAVDGFLIEPSWIEVTRHTVQAPFAGPLKIAHLSDLHTYEVSRRERRLLALLEAEKPDLIVVTGDTLARSGSH